MGLIDKRFSYIGSNEKSTSPNNFFKKILTENIRITACRRGHFFTKIANFMCRREHFLTKMANSMCKRGHFLNKMPPFALCKNIYL